jgi:beta-glucosidase
MKSDRPITISADIRNVGNFETDEIVPLYIRDKVGSITCPIKELKGFQKIHLKQGDLKKVTFELKPEDLEFFNGKYYVIEPGDFDVWIAPNSDEGLKGKFVYQ